MFDIQHIFCNISLKSILSRHSPSTFFVCIQSTVRGEVCRLFTTVWTSSRRRICSNVLNTSAEHINYSSSTPAFSVLLNVWWWRATSMLEKLKLIIFRFTHFFSFIHLARLCIVYYFCRFSVVQGKSLRDLARAKEILPIKSS